MSSQEPHAQPGASEQGLLRRLVPLWLVDPDSADHQRGYQERHPVHEHRDGCGEGLDQAAGEGRTHDERARTRRTQQ